MTDDLIAEARAWCEDAFSDMPADATDAEVRACVAAQYEGGWAAFVADGSPRVRPAELDAQASESEAVRA